MNPFIWSNLLCGLSSLALAIFATIYGRTKAQRLFILFNIAVALWGFGNFAAGIARTPEAAILAWRFAYLGGFFISTFFYHLVQVFFDRPHRKNLFLAYVHSFAFAALIVAFPKSMIEHTRLAFGIHYNAATLPMGLAIFSFILIVSLSYKMLIQYVLSTKNPNKMQAKYFIVGFAFGFLGGATTLLPPFGIDAIYPLGNLGVTFYAFILVYAIFKHQVLEIRVFIKRTLFYSLMVFLVSIGYIAVIFTAHKLILGEAPQSSVFQKLIPLYSIPSLIGTISFAALGLFVFLNKPRTTEKLIFSTLCFQTFFWELVWFDSFFVHDDLFLRYLAKIVYFTITPLPFTFYHFIVSYLKQKKEYKYVVAFYVFALTLMVLIFPTDLFIKGNQKFVWGNFSWPGPLYILFMAGAFISMVRGLVILGRALHDAKDNPVVQNQIRYLLLGFGLYFFCTLDFFQVYGAKWFPIGTFFFILSFLVIAYAISKHQLLDVRVVIKKTLFYSAMTATVSLIYLSLVLIFHTFFLKGGKENAPFLVNFAGILFIAITFKPVEMAIHRLMERRFFKGTISEIAEQKERLETELERRERLKSVGILAAGMAHEIKNPLTAINTFAEYLPEKYQDAEFREKFSRIIKQEVSRIRDIVANLLLFSKPAEPNKRACNLNDSLTSVLDLLSNEMLKANIKSSQHLTEHQAMADSDQLKQVFLNIIMNAIDAMKSGGGEMTVRTSIVGDHVEISVEDSGCGISADRLPHIFDPFYTSKEGGTGLGLSVTHSIIEKNNGKITVESKVNKGTRFKILIPLHTPSSLLR